MPGINPSTSHYEDPTFRADDAVEVAIKKFIQSLFGGTVSLPQAGAFSIPPYDTVEFTYVSAGAADDDLIQTQTFKKDGATVATLTYAYVGSTNNIASITQT
jgi:hypothetical protein